MKLFIISSSQGVQKNYVYHSGQNRPSQLWMLLSRQPIQTPSAVLHDIL